MTARPTPPESPRPLANRLLWFAGLWLASVASLSIVAFLIRAALGL